MRSWYLSNENMRKLLSIFLPAAAGFLLRIQLREEKAGGAAKTVTVSPTSLSIPPEGAGSPFRDR